mmetsp:Transcript_6676/g.15305  ORF Transcript_6676/g.15305 Transcript_6676/m.15305 type:complete len:204 (-) Transcript_6676:461-1072(-)
MNRGRVGQRPEGRHHHPRERRMQQVEHPAQRPQQLSLAVAADKTVFGAAIGAVGARFDGGSLEEVGAVGFPRGHERRGGFFGQRQPPRSLLDLALAPPLPLFFGRLVGRPNKLLALGALRSRGLLGHQLGDDGLGREVRRIPRDPRRHVTRQVPARERGRCRLGRKRLVRHRLGSLQGHGRFFKGGLPCAACFIAARAAALAR